MENMDLSKTFIPGMDSGNERKMADLYSRSSANKESAEQSASASNATIVPGMINPADSAQPEGERRESSSPQKPASAVPVVGFLYSVSRMGVGEYWPLHIGSNTIGRSNSCDVQLKEMSVSDMHAVLNVRTMKTTGELIAVVQDKGSKNGLFLNETELDYEQYLCKNGDILKVGEGYELLIILINARQVGLKAAENFTPSQEQKPVAGPTNDIYRRRSPRTEDGTVSMNGDEFWDNGGTKFM